ncbi:Fasciclin-like arabinogalactan protein 19 [Carex littledalei]|uniref:Fasciclin-like arabinogalactan protein 19 n=1 Tax=Carex littledalei TaxID=544730 RepID=A0A833QXR2_9POAL|nr:Fasciclin-like arabinogalactan protein 19 [Carex littledalei]
MTPSIDFCLCYKTRSSLTQPHSKKTRLEKEQSAMAKEKQSLLLLLPFLLLLLTLPSPSLSILESSLNAAITSLRSNSYTLFGNAILTSDLYTDLLSNDSASFTLFAPTDPSLFTLDISTRADLYVSSLRRHVAIGRLQSLTPPFPDALPSLLPDHPVSLSMINGSGIVTANGVVIIAPRIFDGPDLTVHGLAGMLPVRFAYPPSIAPTLSSPPSDRVVEAPMAQMDQISLPPEMARLSLDEISPSPMVLRKGEEWWCLTGEVEEAGCFKVSSDLGLANASPPMTGIEGGL